MHLRLPLLLLLLLGLALGPLPMAAAACAVEQPQVCTSSCCSGAAEMSCCQASKAPAPQPPVQSAPSSVEGKHLLAPVLALVCVRPEVLAEIPTGSPRQVAGYVVAPRVAVTCIRLI